MFRLSRLFTLFVLALVASALCIGLFFIFRDTTPPTITLTPETNAISTSLVFTLTVTDEKNPIRNIAVTAMHSGRSLPVVEKQFNGEDRIQHISFSLQDTGLKEGKIDLEVAATDGGFAGFGNTKTERYAFTVDNTPPKLMVKTAPPNIRRGGSGVIVYSISKPVSQTGIKAGPFFFPGFRQENGEYLCFFAYPYSMDNQSFTPQLVAVDTAGNMQATSLQVNKIFREFRQDTMNISQNFLDRKADEFLKILPEQMPVIDRFLKINSQVRADNAATLMEIGRHTAPKILWNNSFLPLPRGAARAGFGDHRTYLWEGKVVDHQTHLGYDLASTAKADVPAANNGTVVFADYLGIYGNVIILDHGFGLQSLYSHLTDMAVSPGQEVTRGETIGRTGTTGIALGDHLHFGILLSGLEVSPTEWLDTRWIQHNILDRAKEAGAHVPVLHSLPPQPTSPADQPAKDTSKTKPQSGKKQKPSAQKKRTNR